MTDKYNAVFELGFTTFKKGMPYFCNVPAEVYNMTSTPDCNLVLAFCNGYTAAHISGGRND